jgi:ubiquinone/menaquinone biosynthesis C-methylase UbiE
MGLYADHIFPRLMDWVLSGDEFRRLRTALLKPVSGEVLEIGFGTGLNLSHYPSHVAALSVIDPARVLPRRVATRIGMGRFPVHVHHAPAEALPFPDRRFDFVVSTWTLCSVADPVQALREVKRVLRPDGCFLFLEHGQSDDRKVAAWQDRLNPLQNLLACGCNLNRQIDRLIEASGLVITRLDRFRMDTVPRLGGEMYRGQAQ